MAENDVTKPKQHTVLKSWGLVIAILTIIPVAYGFFYFQDRSAYLTNHYFRSLSGIEKQINQGLKGMDFLLGFALVEENENLSQPFKDKFCNENGLTEFNYCQKYKEYLKKYSANFHNIKFSKKAKSCKVSKHEDSQVDKKNDKTCFSITGSYDNKKITVYDEKEPFEDALNKNKELQESVENKTAQPIKSKKTLEAQAREEIQKRYDSEGKVLTVTVPLKDLIDPIPALQYFNRILVLNQEGSVIYRSGSDNLSRTANISAFDDFVRFENLSEYLNSGVAKELEITGKNVNYKDVDQITSHSRVRKATIAGISYLLYIQPFHAVRQQDNDQGDDTSNKAKTSHAHPEKLAYIVGVIPAEKNNKAIMSLPLGRINMLFFAILIILLLTPHLKLLFSGPRFMPNRSFAVLLAVSFPLLAMVLVLGALCAKDYFQLKRSLDNTSKQIGSKISANFEKEYNEILRLDFFSKDKPCFPMFTDKKDDDLEIMLLANNKDKLVYPKFELAYYLDPEGKQAGKQCTYRSFPAIDIKVHRRQYFKQSYYHPEKLSVWPENRKYYSERIETYDHGLKLTAFSFPAPPVYPDPKQFFTALDNPKPKVLAIIKLMHTFFQPVLPAGFGFAVIKDSSGEVLYHSNDQRSLLENFYIETDEDQQIIAATQMRQNQLVSGNYNGHAHNFWITPLDNTPWSLAVFYDTQLMELANIKTSIFSVVYAFLIIILLLIIISICYCIDKTQLEKLKTFLPNGGFWRKIKKSQSTGCFNKIYIFTNVFSLLLISGLIACLCFSCNRDKQVKKIEKFNLLHIGSRLTNRHVALSTEIDRVTQFNAIAPKNIKYLDQDLFHFADYANAGSNIFNNDTIKSPKCDGDAAMQGNETSLQGTISTWFVSYKTGVTCGSKLSEDIEESEFPDEYLPIISSLDSRYQLLSHGSATDKSWSFYKNPAANLVAVFTKSAHPEFQLTSTGHYTQTRDTTAPFWWDTTVPFWWKIYLYLIVPLLLYFLVKLTSVRLFGLGFEQKSDLHESTSKHLPKNAGLRANKDKHEDIAKEHLKTISIEKSDHSMELRSILFHLSHKHMLNYTNALPIKQLIDSEILKQEGGMIEYSNDKLRKFVSHQPWSQATKEYQVQDSTNLWSILAMPFYSLILLAFIFLVLSGGQVGEMILALVPIILTGGFPFISSFIGKRFGMD